VERFAEAVEAIRQTPFQVRPGEPQPKSYYKALFEEPSPRQRQAVASRMTYMRDVFEFGHVDPRGLDVLEAGSGFGVGLAACACLGARTATGVEIVGWQVEWARECARRLPGGLGERIASHVGSVTEMPVEDASADVVLSLEAISHYYDHRPFLDEVRRVLRPGGVLIVSDHNNALNPRTRRENERLWASHEIDPRTYVHPKGDGNYNPWLLAEHRRRIAVERQPSIDEETSWQIALNTAGMLRAEVEAAADLFVETGELPQQPYVPGTVSVHPDHEMVMERMFDPWALGRELRELGFVARVRGHWAGASGKRLHRTADTLLGALSPLTMRTARGFRIAAVRA
jgi:SAM-dependent methyltransferase